jgi:alkanesulfonate monooxygenase SsuD/methylene tetrahydromethanopterin reductase-like flavin-dependent oxidoreductase (luciferase family)
MRFGYFATYFRESEGKTLRQVYQDNAEQVECAEASGFDIIWFPEHHFTHQYCAPNPLMSIVDMARVTRRVKLGTSVVVAPFHHPLALAEEIGMVDHLVDGRLEIGLARGASLYEYDRLGVTDVQAVGRTSECLEILLGIWKEDANYAFRGNHYEFGPTYVVPRPQQQPHPPIWVAARTPETLRFCIERGIGLHTTPLRQPRTAMLTTMKTINAIASEYGNIARPPVIVQTEAFVSDDSHAVMTAMRYLERSHTRGQNFARNGRTPVRGFGSLETLPEGLHISAEQLAERSITGDADGCARQLLDIYAGGVNEFTAVMDFGQPQRVILNSIELFGTRVIPRFRELVTTHGGERLAPTPKAGAAARRAALVEAANRRIGGDWQNWGEPEWVEFFDTRNDPGEASFEKFDFSIGPKGVRADAAGIVGTSGKLFLLRDESCPECGRPALVLCRCKNGESPQRLREMARRSPDWLPWHAIHP